jgi:very-short-patch-repair endonuclease
LALGLGPTGIAERVRTGRLHRIDEAEYRGRFDLTSLNAVVENNPGRRGDKVIALANGPPQRTRSDLEQDFLDFCRRHRLPRPIVGATIAGYEVDFVWPDARLIVETDGLAAHRTRKAMESDRTRDRRALLAGYLTVRLTDRAIREDEHEVARDLRELIRRRRGASAPRPATGASSATGSRSAGSARG